MRHLSLLEKIRYYSARNEEIQLKGKLRLTLEDVRDGTQIVEEVDNLTTNAVQSVLDHNYCGLSKYSALFPLRQLYGGVMCFQNAQTENAANFNPPSDAQNPLIAHAGDAANNTGSTLRGSPVSNDFVITDTSIKQVWLWDNTQGNGHIESVSLCPATLGNMGLKPFNDEFNLFSDFGRDDGVYSTTWSESLSKQFPFNISADGKTAQTVWLDGTTFKEYTMRHDYTAFGIMRGANDWQDVANRTATVRSGNNRFIFDDSDYYYIARATSATALQIDKVSKTTFAVTQADVTFDGVTLWTGSFVAVAKNACMRIFAYDGTYLYYPNSALTSFYRLNISDNSDKALLDGTINVLTGLGYSDAAEFIPPIVINSGLVIGANYIINGANVYPQKDITGVLEDIGYNRTNENFLFLVRQGAAVYGNCTQAVSNNFKAYQGVVLCQMFLSTIANLPTARDKSTSQTMRVEYTSTEET